MCNTTGVCDNCKKESQYLTDCILDGEVNERLCPSCLKEDNSYCLACGQFCAGIESFDFIHPGYCDNCWDEIESDFGDDEDECGEDENFLYDENNHP